MPDLTDQLRALGDTAPAAPETVDQLRGRSRRRQRRRRAVLAGALGAFVVGVAGVAVVARSVDEGPRGPATMPTAPANTTTVGETPSQSADDAVRDWRVAGARRRSPGDPRRHQGRHRKPRGSLGDRTGHTGPRTESDLGCSRLRLPGIRGGPPSRCRRGNPKGIPDAVVPAHLDHGHGPLCLRGPSRRWWPPRFVTHPNRP